MYMLDLIFGGHFFSYGSGKKLWRNDYYRFVFRPFVVIVPSVCYDIKLPRPNSLSNMYTAFNVNDIASFIKH